MLQENEIQCYQEDKKTLFDKKTSNEKNKKLKKEFHFCSECNKKVRHKLKNCWVLHLKKKKEWLKKNSDKNKIKKNDKNNKTAAVVEDSAAASEYLMMLNTDFVTQNDH